MSSYTSVRNGGRSSSGCESPYAVYPPTYSSGWAPGIGVIPQSDPVPLNTIVPGSVRPTEAQLNTAYGYAIQREDGSFTRLIRADNLEPINGISQSQGPEGLIIVPEPRQPSPRRQHTEIYIPRTIVDDLHNSVTRHRAMTNTSQASSSDPTQIAIDAIVAQSGMSSPPSRAPFFKREKIYCDKWIHEGVCAFTQMGCKYKHEMPMDRATQQTLGLNHGLPNWYRRAYGVNLSSPPTDSPIGSIASLPNSNRLAGPWRRIESSPSMNNGGREQSHGPPGRRASFGPIGSPIGPPAFQSNGKADPYAHFNLGPIKDEQESNADSHNVTWPGRHH
ncbi:hypothetical protein BGZ60DRAFT_97821 [Tricladium varicosporioides]|nr:hypothetical protein BGZ60DRAFT_97821 [Hymenoscyphus varicosporioides]